MTRIDDEDYLRRKAEFDAEDMPRRVALDTELRRLVTDEDLITHIRETGGAEGHLPLLWQPRYSQWVFSDEQIPAVSLNAGGGIQSHTRFAGNVHLTIAYLLPLEGQSWRLPNGGVLPANEEDIRNLSDFISNGTGFVITTHEGRNPVANAAMLGRMLASRYGGGFLGGIARPQSLRSLVENGRGDIQSKVERVARIV